jgi:hypothetical protein
MAELFFIATTIFVAYVFFVVMGDKKGKSQPVTAAKPAPAAQSTPAETPAPTPSVAVAEAVSSPAATAPAARKPRASKAAAAGVKTTVDSLKNPKTGETAKVPASYSFAKRWIKDALVEEGLLDKVYKNNELDADTNAKIQAALTQLRGMDKYQ